MGCPPTLFCRFVFNTFPKVYNIFDATVQKFLLKALKTTAHTVYAWATLFGSALVLRLSATLGHGLKMKISNIVSSIFSDLTSEIANPFAKPQDSLPVGSIFYFFQLLDFCALY